MGLIPTPKIKKKNGYETQDPYPKSNNFGYENTIFFSFSKKSTIILKKCQNNFFTKQTETKLLPSDFPYQEIIYFF